MVFVVMLTRNDATVENALDLLEIAREPGLRPIGSKDVGAKRRMLRLLTAGGESLAAVSEDSEGSPL